MAEPTAPRPTGNVVVDREDNMKDANGIRKPRDTFETFRNVFGGRFTPPVEQPKVAALEPDPKLNPVLLPALPDRSGLSGLDAYRASRGQISNEDVTLFYPQPPNDVAIPRAVDSQNLTAVPPRFTMSSIYQVFNKPRKGTPGFNPMGINTTATP